MITTIIILVPGLIFLMLLGIPVVYSLGITSLLCLFFERGMDFSFTILAQRMVGGINNFTLLAVPFFILAAQIMNRGGITNRIFNFANALVGHLPGGLGQVNIVASIIFAGMSGSASADAAGLGQIELKAMNDAGYDKAFSVAVTGASSVVGPIIPPSIPLVLYGASANASIGALLMGGLIPGLLLGIALMVYVAIYANFKSFPKSNKFTLQEIWVSFKEAFFPLLTPVILIVGISTGWFTATEAAVVAVSYAFIVAFIYGEISWAVLPEILTETMKLTASAVVIVTTANLYCYLILRAGVPQYFAEMLSAITTSPNVTMFIIVAFLLAMGTIMDPIPGILILTPILVPHIRSLGISEIHFGLIMVLSLMVGLLTPPVGMVLYILQKVSKVPFEKIVHALLPFFVPIIITLILLVLFPNITLFLPNLLFNR